jgi:hypothetical protein
MAKVGISTPPGKSIRSGLRLERHGLKHEQRKSNPTIKNYQKLP